MLVGTGRLGSTSYAHGQTWQDHVSCSRKTQLHGRKTQLLLATWMDASDFLFKNMSHCLTLTPNPLLFTYLIVNLTPSVFLLAFGL